MRNIYRDLNNEMAQRGIAEGRLKRQETQKRDEQNAFNRQRQVEQDTLARDRDSFDRQRLTGSDDLAKKKFGLEEKTNEQNIKVSEQGLAQNTAIAARNEQTWQEAEDDKKNAGILAGLSLERQDAIAKAYRALKFKDELALADVLKSFNGKVGNITESEDGGITIYNASNEVISTFPPRVVQYTGRQLNNREQKERDTAAAIKGVRDMGGGTAAAIKGVRDMGGGTGGSGGSSGGTRGTPTGKVGPVTSNGTMWAEKISALGYDLDDVGSFDNKDNTKFVFHSKIAQTLEHVRTNNPGLSDNEIIEIAMKYNDVNSVSGDDYNRQKLQSEHEERKSTVNEIEQALARVEKASTSKDVSPEDAKYYTLELFGQHGLLPAPTALTKKLLSENKQRIKEIEDAYVEMDNKKAKVQGVYDTAKAHELKKITLSVKDVEGMRGDLVKLVDAHKAGKNPSQETINAMIDKYRKVLFNRYNDPDFFDAAMKEVEWLFKQAGGGKLPSKNLKADEEAQATPATKKDLSKSN